MRYNGASDKSVFMVHIEFASWYDGNCKLIGDLEDEQLGENEIQWMNYEETMAAWEVTV